jgi:hypothetical protein
MNAYVITGSSYFTKGYDWCADKMRPEIEAQHQATGKQLVHS